MNSVIVTMTTEGYAPYMPYFVKALRKNNKHKIICYLVNVKSKMPEFPGVEYIEYPKTKVEKWHGIDCVSNMKPELLLDALKGEGKHLIWIDNSKLILCSLGFIDNEIDKYDGVFLRRPNSPQVANDYWGGIFAFNKDGKALQKYQEVIVSDKVGETRGGWMSDQEALYYVEGNKLDLDYYQYVSSNYNTKFPILRNMPHVRSKNITQKNADKNRDALEMYEKILTRGERKPKVLIIMNSGNRKWCWGTSADTVANALKDKFDFKICTQLNMAEIEEFKPDVVWSRGSMIWNKPIYRQYPHLIPKTIATFTIGGQMLAGRIRKEVPFEVNCWGWLVQNEQAVQKLTEWMQEVGMSKHCLLIPPPVDTEKFKPMAEYSPSEFTVGFAARRDNDQKIRQKGYDLVEAACKKLGVPLKVGSTNRGERIPHEKMPEFMNSITVFVLPSYAEGCSNATMEAMACGTPAIIYKTGYHGENCKDGEEVLFVEREVDDLVKKVAAVRDDTVLRQRLSVQGREFALRHNMDALGARYADMFQRAYDELSVMVPDKSKWTLGELPLRRKPKPIEIKEGDVLKLKYMGPKPKKVVEYNSRRYEFKPVCEVDDKPALEWLLSPEMDGLFQVVKDEPAKEPEEVKQMEHDEVVCRECGFVAKSANGLRLHMFKHKPRK